MPKRKAAQRSNGSRAYSQGTSLKKTKKHTRSVVLPSAPTSIMLQSFLRREQRCCHAKTRGATTSVPAASPTHQVTQEYPNRSAGTMSPKSRLNTPKVGLIMQQPNAPTMIRINTFFPLWRGCSPLQKRRTKRAPAAAPKVAPMPIIAPTRALSGPTWTDDWNYRKKNKVFAKKDPIHTPIKAWGLE